MVTYQTSVSQLTPAAQQLFRILSWLAPDPIPMSALEKLSVLPTPCTHLVALADLHLARLTPDGQNCTVHRMLQEITRWEQSAPQPEALVQALKWINGEYQGEPEDVRTWPLLVPLTPHALSAAYAGADRGISEPCGRLLNQSGMLKQSQANFAGPSRS